MLLAMLLQLQVTQRERSGFVEEREVKRAHNVKGQKGGGGVLFGEGQFQAELQRNAGRSRYLVR